MVVGYHTDFQHTMRATTHSHRRYRGLLMSRREKPQHGSNLRFATMTLFDPRTVVQSFLGRSLDGHIQVYPYVTATQRIEN